MLGLESGKKGIEGSHATVVIRLEPKGIVDPGTQTFRAPLRNGRMPGGQELGIDGGGEPLPTFHTFMLPQCYGHSKRVPAASIPERPSGQARFGRWRRTRITIRTISSPKSLGSALGLL